MKDIIKEIIEIDEQIKEGIVPTELLLQRIVLLSQMAGINAVNDIESYERCVTMLEILSIVTPYLNKEYYDEKEKLYKKLEDASIELKKQMFRFDRGNKNEKIRLELTQLKMQYIDDWFRLIMLKTKSKYQQQYGKVKL